MMQEENQENKEKKKEIHKITHKKKRKTTQIKTKNKNKKFIIYPLLNFQTFKSNKLMKINNKVFLG